MEANSQPGRRGRRRIGKDIRQIVALPVKLAILSQFSPPSPYVSGLMLYRILKDLEPEDYCLLSDKDYEAYSYTQNLSPKDSKNLTPRLPARYYHLSSSLLKPRSKLLVGGDEPSEGIAPTTTTTRLESGLERPKLALESKPAKGLRKRMPALLKPQMARKLINYWRTIRRLVKEVLVALPRAREVARVVERERCDTILACSGAGDPFDLPVGYLASRLVGVPFYAYLFDDYLHQWAPTPYRYFARMIEPSVLKGAAGIIVPNEFLGEDYYHRYQLKPTVIHNPIDLSQTKDSTVAAPWPTEAGQVSIVYTGTIYHAHYDAFRSLLEAIRQLDHPDISLHLYTTQIRQELEQKGICGPEVVYHEQVSSSEALEVQRRADILLLPLAFSSSIPEVIRTSSPGKMGEYLASGRPILVHAPADSFVCWYFREHECGLVVDQSDPTILARAIQRIMEEADLRQKMGENARARAATDFSLRSARAEFFEVLQPKVKRKE